MTQHAVLTAIGADRPGLVDEVSRFIFESGGNIEDSRMVNLRGQFAMMLLVGASSQTMHKLHTHALSLIKQTGLHVEIRAIEGQKTPGKPALPYCLIASAMDQAGLVHRIARVLREMNVNIEDMQTDLTDAPITGTPLFEMKVTLSVPADLSISRLRQSLTKLCDESNIDWQLSAL